MVLLLIVPFTAIIGILAAIAIPAYRDYTIRARVSEALLMANDAKIAVSEYAEREQRFPQDNTEVGIKEDSNGRLIGNIKIDQGVIYLQLTPETGTSGLIILVPSYSAGATTWSCTESTIEPRYLPAMCRKEQTE